MNSEYKKQDKPSLTQKEQFIEFAAISVAILLLLACAIKVIFI